MGAFIVWDDQSKRYFGKCDLLTKEVLYVFECTSQGYKERDIELFKNVPTQIMDRKT